MPVWLSCLAKELRSELLREIELETEVNCFSGREYLSVRLEVEGCLQKLIESGLVEFGALDEMLEVLLPRRMMSTSRWRALLVESLEMAT